MEFSFAFFKSLAKVTNGSQDYLNVSESNKFVNYINQSFVMFELLSQSIKERVSISEEEFDYAKTLFIPKKLRKRQYLLQEGDVCKYTAFVEKGMLRTFTVDEKGNEPILQFSMEGWWVADLYSFFTGEPSPYNIEALEDCELLLITQPSWEMLLQKIPVLERYFRILVQNNLIATQRRLMGAMSETAEEKYTKLINNFPGCLQRVPQHMIASYLGITRETLSRIRSQMAARK
jgi:CRP-like cAMP-binding protein